jgi:hypothetical protein
VAWCIRAQHIPTLGGRIISILYRAYRTSRHDTANARKAAGGLCAMMCGMLITRHAWNLRGAGERACARGMRRDVR